MRAFWTIIHRWLGLTAAAFLFLTGLTGAVISWDHELDDLLNPHLMEAKSSGSALPSLELVRGIEERHPQVRVTFFPLEVEPGESFAAGVQPRVDSKTEKLYEPGFKRKARAAQSAKASVSRSAGLRARTQSAEV